MKKVHITEDEVRYLISKISENRSERKIGLEKLILKLEQSIEPKKTSLDRNLICIINSDDQGLLAKELNEYEGIVSFNPISDYHFDERYCYIGFFEGSWQTIDYKLLTENKKLITFTELKNLIS